MEEAVVGAVVGASVQILLQNLLSIPEQEINLFQGFKKGLKKLQNSFLMIQDFLDDAEMQQVTNKAVKRWLKKLEAVAYDADDVLDELNYTVLRRKIKKSNKKVQTFFSRSNSVAFRRKMAQKIKNINEKLELINQEATGFGLQMRFAGAHAPNAVSNTADGRETDSYTADPIVLGREDDVSGIVEIITSQLNKCCLSFQLLGWEDWGRQP
ncbi:hypothetical protein Sango_0626800 [Sesamum angolense]|uniref:Disease resistance N-terminal domain-containing protein n=1 Tax=Sesamum angolense TaxID=2727404 RepID=A0AAE2C241_9LAMI|nr:hypothetical protein Sango_0626800 [Sesamum angolense]